MIHYFKKMLSKRLALLVKIATVLFSMIKNDETYVVYTLLTRNRTELLGRFLYSCSGIFHVSKCYSNRVYKDANKSSLINIPKLTSVGKSLAATTYINKLDLS